MTMSKSPFIFVIFVIVSVFLPWCIASDSENELPFTYEEGTGKGPNEWGQIKPEWEACGNGKMQSPINLFDERVQIMPRVGKLQWDYKPAPATLMNRGHDIAVKWKEDAGKININGTCYNLVQCHWHTPSEHMINGSRYNLELHIIHSSSNGSIAVIGILYEYGHPDHFLSKLLNHIRIAGKEEQDLGVINLGSVQFGSKKYYKYIGSLTTPPCTEGVVWTIIEKVRTASREQVRALRDAINDGFEQNAKPLQQLHGRPIFFYTP